METINLIMPSTNMVALDNNWKNEAEEAILVSESRKNSNLNDLHLLKPIQMR